MGDANQSGDTAVQDERYLSVASDFGAALERLSRAYEADPDQRLDLLQDIHLALWRSFANFDGRCSERTWAYRVAHNVATSHMLRRRRVGSRKMVTLDELADRRDEAQADPEVMAGDRQNLIRLTLLVQALAAPDRQIVLLYLEGLEAAEIGVVCGLTAGAVATKVHRLKGVLAQQFNPGGDHVG
jgi:RNA polymerase sigma-70 factor (ECF subfamily)